MPNDDYQNDADEIRDQGDDIGRAGEEGKEHSTNEARHALKQGRENLKEGQSLIDRAHKVNPQSKGQSGGGPRSSGQSSGGRVRQGVGKLSGNIGKISGNTGKVLGRLSGEGGKRVGFAAGRGGKAVGQGVGKLASTAGKGIAKLGGVWGTVAIVAVKHWKIVVALIAINLIIYLTLLFMFASVVLCLKKFIGSGPIGAIKSVVSAIIGNKSCDNPADAADANAVTVTKTGPETVINPDGKGPDMKYTITIAFTGQAQDITITDTLLTTNATFVSASGKHTTDPPGDGPDTKSITWSAAENGFPFGGGGTAAACGQKTDVPGGAAAVGDICSQGNRSSKLNVVSKKIKDNGFYEPTHFGCSQGSTDANDNCVPACPISDIPECAGLTGKACEEKLNYFAANASQYGCGAVLKVTNPQNGKAVIVRVIDEGPNCSVQGTNAKFDISKAAYDAIGANGTVKVEKVAGGTKVGPVNACTDGGNQQPPAGGTTVSGGGTTYEVVFRPKDKDSFVINKAAATVMGAGTGTGTNDDTGTGTNGYAAPSENACNGKYTAAIGKTSLKKNFGDPTCAYSKDKLFALLKKEDPKNARYWFDTVIKCESGYNPNAYAGHVQTGTPDASGAWGLYQMGSSKPPGSAPPAKGKNGAYDRGDVNWEMQTTNAINYRDKTIGGKWTYWACAKSKW